MRWSRTLIPTLKEAPADAEATNHILMVRAGMIRKLGSGAYIYLPLGKRSLEKVQNIIREEMDRAGAIEVFFPAILPIEILEESGRLDVFGEDLVKFTDRHGRKNALGPTHEEVVTSIVRDEVKSYRQLPINLYQIQTKFRDEVRPRHGVLRTREFIMKDAYSFDMDAEGLNASYQKMYDAYCRIFERCGLKCVIVEADTGAMGGDVSHEFMVASEVGDDMFVTCDGCGYQANLEKAEVAPVEPAKGGELQSLENVDTPGQATIEQVSAFLKISPTLMIKTLIYMTDAGEPIAALLRGDHEINEKKLAKALGVKAVELADEATIEKVTGAPVGFAGPHTLRCKLVADHAILGIRNGVTGGNKKDVHTLNVNPGRDFQPEIVADTHVAAPGDKCPKCGTEMIISHGIEVGHVFKLGTKYADSMSARFLDPEGQEKPYIMGCYGIGVNRILAAMIEQNHDENGIVWSPGIAPYEVAVLALNVRDDAIREAAERTYETLREAGVDVLYDDRDLRPGFKFKDADLIGFPLRIVVGKGFLNSGELEFERRSDGVKHSVPEAEIVQVVKDALAELAGK